MKGVKKILIGVNFNSNKALPIHKQDTLEEGFLKTLGYMTFKNKHNNLKVTPY